MYRVIFRNSRGQERQIGTAQDQQAADKIIKEFLDEHNFVSYYTRGWIEDGRLWLDVGSWTEFFILEEINKTDYEIDKNTKVHIEPDRPDMFQMF